MLEEAASTSTHEVLSRELIAQKALEFADREGIENLSARKLAADLGKTAMSLYRHFDSIDDIRAAAVSLAFTEVDTEAIPGERWDDTIRRFACSVRDMYHRHINANLAVVPTGVDSPALKEYIDKIRVVQTEQGIPPQILYKLWRITDAFLTGFLTNELVTLRAAMDNLTADEQAWQDYTVDTYSEQAFHDGFDIILSGIAMLAAPDPADWHTPDSTEI